MFRMFRMFRMLGYRYFTGSMINFYFPIPIYHLSQYKRRKYVLFVIPFLILDSLGVNDKGYVYLLGYGYR